MRRTINISISEEMHAYILGECRYATVSEYIRSLVRGEQQRRADHAARPTSSPRRANDAFILSKALEHLDKLKAILERSDPLDD